MPTGSRPKNQEMPTIFDFWKILWYKFYLESVVLKWAKCPQDVLEMMRKPKFALFDTFKKRFEKICKEKKLNQEIIPYFISSHPACGKEDMANLAAKTKELGYKLEQVQDFTPTPMTLATVIYYSGIHPYTLKPVQTAVTENEKSKQRQFFFWYKEENKNFIRNYLSSIKRLDLAQKLFSSRA